MGDLALLGLEDCLDIEEWSLMVHHDQGTACGKRGPTHCSAAFTSLAIHSCLVVTGVNTQGSYH